MNIFDSPINPNPPGSSRYERDNTCDYLSIVIEIPIDDDNNDSDLDPNSLLEKINKELVSNGITSFSIRVSTDCAIIRYSQT